jgi:flagellar biosynthetic protein FliR
MIDAAIVAVVLVFVRTSAFLSVLPAPLGRDVPMTVKIGLSAALALFCAPAVVPSAGWAVWERVHSSHGLFWSVYFCGREIVLGCAMGWLLGQMLLPARVAGAYLAQEMGLTLGALTSPQDQQPTNVISEVLEVLAISLCLGANLHYVWIWSLQQSLTSFPVAGLWSSPSRELVVAQVSRGESLGLMIVGPVIVVMLLALILLLLTSRTAPHFNLISYGMSFRLIVGIGALLLFLPEITAGLQQAVALMISLPGA